MGDAEKLELPRAEHLPDRVSDFRDAYRREQIGPSYRKRRLDGALPRSGRQR